MSNERRGRKSMPGVERESWRIIAPFVRIIRKNVHTQVEKPREQILNKLFLEQVFKEIQDGSASFAEPKVMHNTTEMLQTITKSTGSSIYIVDETFNEIKLLPKHIGGSRHTINWKIELGTTVAAYCAYQKTYVALNDIQDDHRFPEKIGYMDHKVKAVLCVPILTPDGNCLGVIELCRGLFQEPYKPEDIKIAVAVTGWMGAALNQNKERISMRNQKRIHDCLLDLIKCFFLNDLPLITMISDIVKLAKIAVNAQKGTFYVINPTSDDLAADVYEEGVEGDTMYKKSLKINLRTDKSIQGMVARQGIALRFQHGSDQPIEKRDIDNYSGLITKCVLSTPIKNDKDVIGIIQVVNKTNEHEGFSKSDENIFNIIAVYCALALHYDYLRQKLTSNTYLDECYLELLYRHMRPCIHEIMHVQQNLDIKYPPEFDTFYWMPTQDNMEFLPQYSIFIFMSIIGDENLNHYSLLEFVLTVKKLYRPQPYHNFLHAFWVMHTMYNILLRNMKVFSVMERYALIIAAFCHDIDHRGLTNNFLAMKKDNLAALYSESTMECHHFVITKMVLKQIPFLKNIKEEEYAVLEREIKENILATDISVHFKVRSKLQTLINDDTFDWRNESHRSLLKAIIMSGCDLSHNAKPFFVARPILTSLYQEFYAQGDKEKNMGLSPLPLMDREKNALIPDDQVQFQNVLTIPCYQMLAALLPNTKALLKLATKLKENWMEIIEMKACKHWKHFESIVAKK